MSGTETHWHVKAFIAPDPARPAYVTWRPITPGRAVQLLTHGMYGFVRLGPPEFNADAARAAVVGSVQ